QKYPDYLCLQSQLESLKGNKFKSQRASCNYFVKHNDFETGRLRPADKPACLALFAEWARSRKKNCEDEIYCGMIEDNRKVIRETLGNYRQLGLEGIAVKIDGKLKGFTFGYPLSKEIFCVFYEITDLSIKGLAQFIFRKFSSILKKYNYINIMDDSGLDNLRKVKLSYKPRRLIPSYIVTRDA
ncbi:MAG: phosphatidylglycerol lysyltransferase domain-containing protein, partial [Candidatus Omnitrophica bacterium]|nr:phosphatidylglycerol lysyltransferase domain-containing protein [Candidatus Omnitrophota bacterium]